MPASASESMLVSASLTSVVYSLSNGPRCHARFAHSGLQVTINELSTRTKMGRLRDALPSKIY